MFFKLSTIVALVPFVVALTMQAPDHPTTDGQITIKWSSETTDNVFSIELHHPSFSNDLAIANNVNPDEGSKTLTLPSVPVQDGYTLRAVNITNINQVYSESPAFSIGASTVTAVGSSTGSSTATGSGAAGNNSASATAPLSVSTSSSSSFGVVVSSPTNTGTGSANSATSQSNNGTSSAATSTPTNLNGGAFASAKVSTTLGLLAAVAGVAAVAF